MAPSRPPEPSTRLTTTTPSPSPRRAPAAPRILPASRFRASATMPSTIAAIPAIGTRKEPDQEQDVGDDAHRCRRRIAHRPHRQSDPSAEPHQRDRREHEGPGTCPHPSLRHGLHLRHHVLTVVVWRSVGPWTASATSRPNTTATRPRPKRCKNDPEDSPALQEGIDVADVRLLPGTGGPDDDGDIDYPEP